MTWAWVGLWILFTGAGWAMSWVLVLGWTMALGLALFSIGQWALLRFRVTGLIGWAPVAVVGWAVSLGLALANSDLNLLGTGGSMFWAPIGFTAGVIGGAVAGFGQWLQLRKRTRGAGIWIVILAVSWGIGLALFWPTVGTENTEGLGWALIRGLSGLVVGTSSGLGINLLLRKSRLT